MNKLELKAMVERVLKRVETLEAKVESLEASKPKSRRKPKENKDD